MKTFTEDEKIIARNIDKEYKWMARDSDGVLCVFKKKPRKSGNGWGGWYSDGYKYISYFNHLFSAIKWDDEEPTRISDIYNPPILSDAEREYLKMVLEPFHEEVEYVKKIADYKADYENEYLFIVFCKGAFSFPDFEAGTRYSGMEPYKEYKLDELGITYEE